MKTYDHETSSNDHDQRGGLWNWSLTNKNIIHVLGISTGSHAIKPVHGVL
jgi:hypothetical protein